MLGSCFPRFLKKGGLLMYVLSGFHWYLSVLGTSSAFQRSVPLLIFSYTSVNICALTCFCTVSITFWRDGHMSFRNTSLPFLSCPIGSVSKSMSERPASAYATTRGGLARYAPLTSLWTRASKFLFPESTAVVTRFPCSIALLTSSSNSPELPMQVMHPNPAM